MKRFEAKIAKRLEKAREEMESAMRDYSYYRRIAHFREVTDE